MFWFNKWYSKQRNDYNAVVRLILIDGFPIHTLRLLRSLALASQFTLCIPFASVLSGFSTDSPHTFCIRPLRLLNWLRTPFASVLSGFSTDSAFSVSLPFPVLRNTCPETPVARVTQALSTKTVHLKRPSDTSMYRRCRGSRHLLSTMLHVFGVI